MNSIKQKSNIKGNDETKNKTLIEKESKKKKN
jgi:hypothetical protein